MKRRTISYIFVAMFAFVVGIVVTYFVIIQSQFQENTFVGFNYPYVEDQDVMANIALHYEDENKDQTDVLLMQYEDELEEFLQVLNYLRTDHRFYDEENDLIRAAIEGMIAATNDPWTYFFSREEHEEFWAPWTTGSSSIGIRVMQIDNHAVIFDVIQDSPAERDGVRRGDAIKSVDGEEVNEYNFEEVINKIWGESGTVVTLDLERASESFSLDITREYIPTDDVISNVLEHEGKMIGYIRIPNFGVNTPVQFSAVLSELESNGIDGLIIDLRDNSGGSIETLNLLLDELLPSGRVVSSMLDHAGVETSQSTSGSSDYRIDVDIVTLINGGSLSASEMFAAAMMEAGGYEVLGTTSFGKGTIQYGMNVGNNMLHLTMYEVLTPSGNPIEGYGITPTIYVEAPEFYSYLPIHLSQDVILARHMIDTRISSAQLILNTLGYHVNHIDGYFDDSTVNAVYEFQQSNNLSTTGYIDQETATALSIALFDRITNPEYDIQILSAIEHLVR